MASRVSRTAALNVGVTGVDRYSQTDDVHLPAGKTPRAIFLPETKALDSILKPETLEERLARAVVPQEISPALLEPATLSATRLALKNRLANAAAQAQGAARDTLLSGANILEEEVALDEEIRAALAALMRG